MNPVKFIILTCNRIRGFTKVVYLDPRNFKLLQILANFTKSSKKNEFGRAEVRLLQNLEDIQRPTETAEGKVDIKEIKYFASFP